MKGLGDLISGALAAAGVTEEKVSAWLGGECGCAERRERLNAVSAWAARVAGGALDRAGEYLGQIMGES